MCSFPSFPLCSFPSNHYKSLFINEEFTRDISRNESNISHNDSNIKQYFLHIHNKTGFWYVCFFLHLFCPLVVFQTSIYFLFMFIFLSCFTNTYIVDCHFSAVEFVQILVSSRQFQVTFIRWSKYKLTTDAPCLALAGEPWDFCFELYGKTAAFYRNLTYRWVEYHGNKYFCLGLPHSGHEALRYPW